MLQATEPAKTSPQNPWPRPHDHNPLYPIILATVVLCSILTTCFTAARLITKRLISSYDLADYMLMMAWVASIAFEFNLLAAGMAGLGHDHVEHLRKTRLIRLDLYAWAIDILYIPTLWLAKASLLLQLRRIFTPTEPDPVYRACHALIWGNLALYVPIFFLVIFECHPVWESLIPAYKDYCINKNTLQVVSSAFNLFLDFLNLLLPIWAMWYSKMTPGTKAGLTAIFAAGLFAFASSICRFVYSTHSITNANFSYIDAQAALWGLAEITAIILCTCFPLIPRFFKFARDRCSNPKPSPPSPIKHVRKSKIFKIVKAQNSIGISSDRPKEEDMAWLKSPYEQLDEGGIDARGRVDVVKDLEAKRTVGIRMASWDQLNAKSRVASMV